MRIATWNVNGIRARQAELADWLGRERPDVLCLQELKAELPQIPEVCRIEDYWVFWHCRKGYSGVSLHVRKDLVEREPVYSHPPFDMESRIVQTELGNTVLASVYAPNGGKDYPAKINFFERLIDWSGELHEAGRELILCGDMNIAAEVIDVHPKERNPATIGQKPEERELFAKLLGKNLIDVGRSLNPDAQDMFSWWAPWRSMRSRNIGWRLDYVLASRAIATRATSCVVLKDVGTSDHAPVMMTTL
jgi:exodeoxyribonuclease-3